LAASLDALLADAGCCVIRRSDQTGTPNRGASRSGSEPALTELGRQVVAAGAHGGLWVSGDGERLRVVDQQGATIEDDALWLTLVRYLSDERPSAIVVVNDSTNVETRERSSRYGTTVLTAADTREAIYCAMQAEGALLGRGSSGQYWFAGEPPAPDALVAISLLLRVLSQSDRAVSDALANRAAEPG
jgi:phosphomannomutase